MEGLLIAEIIFLICIGIIMLSFSFLMIILGIKQIQDMIIERKIRKELEKK